MSEMWELPKTAREPFPEPEVESFYEGVHFSLVEGNIIPIAREGVRDQLVLLAGKKYKFVFSAQPEPIAE